jgi:tetratricopeptide (TPR) repeat protein
VTPQALVDQVWIPARRGALQPEMLAAARRHDRLPWLLEPDLRSLAAELDAGRPVVVLQNLGVGFLPVWHYAVVVGLDPTEGVVVLRSGERPRARMSIADFLETWERAGRWAFVTLRPGELPAMPDRTRYLEAVAALEGAGRAESARAAHAAGLERWPDERLFALGLGNTAYALGELAGAEAAFRRALAIAPHDVAAINNLAHVEAERGCTSSARARLAAALAAMAPDHPLRPSLTQTASALERRPRTPEPVHCGAR